MARSLSNAQSVTEEHVVTFKLYSDYIVVVQGTIGNIPKRNLVIDTGAYPSVIDRDLARKLGLAGHKGPMRVVEQTLAAESVWLPELEIGSIRSQNTRAVVQDLGPISREFGVRVDAMIGLDVLAHRSFRIDYKRRTIVFGRVDTLSWSAPMQQPSGMACIDVRVGGRLQRLLLDTGAGGFLLFANRAGWVPRNAGYLRQSTNLGGSFTLRQIKANNVVVGEQNLGDREILISDADNMSVYPFDGLLAPAALGFRQIAFDFDRGIFSWETSDREHSAPEPSAPNNHAGAVLSAAFPESHE
jgi:predicted aspartyl protease